MAIFNNGTKKITEMYANVNGEKKKIISAWANKDGVATKVFGSENTGNTNRFMFIAQGDSNNTHDFYVSKDGKLWEVVYSSVYSVSGKYCYITYGNDRFLRSFAPLSATETQYAYYSTDNGKTWTKSTTGIGKRGVYNATYGNGIFVLINDSAEVYCSDDLGVTWTKTATLNDYSYSWAITYGNGMFVVVDVHGYAFYSEDGTTWTEATGITTTTNIDNNFRSVAYGNGRFVVVRHGTPYYSIDGKTWVESTVSLSAITSITYGNGRFVTVGSYGKSYYSFDGETWVEMGGIEDSTQYDAYVTYGNGIFVAVFGYDGIYNSADGETWTRVDFEDIGSREVSTIAYSVDGGYDNS